MSGARKNQNALLILTNMKYWFYFCQPTNLAFHDLMIGKVAPKALQLLMVLGVNFCPNPLHSELNIDKSMERRGVGKIFTPRPNSDCSNVVATVSFVIL